MTNPAEENVREPFIAPGEPADSGAEPPLAPAEHPVPPGQYDGATVPSIADSAAPPPAAPPYSCAPLPNDEQPLFRSFIQPPARPPVRIPHFGHLMLAVLLLVAALAGLALGLGIASHFHLFGFNLSLASAYDLKFNLLSEAALYLITFALSLVVFPAIWNESFFTGLHWRAAIVRSRFWFLAGIALTCFGLAILDQVAMPGPGNAPIEKMMSSTSAAWLMFAFGVTAAPFFEEMFFRGFLLPALATGCDWIAEKIKHSVPRPIDADGQPQWSIPAMIVASIATSLPFALLHVAQQGHSLGPFLLLILVSLVLCAVRLVTRSLAASTTVHAMYNFLIFFVELAATGGFRHFDKM